MWSKAVSLVESHYSPASAGVDALKEHNPNALIWVTYNSNSENCKLIYLQWKFGWSISHSIAGQTIFLWSNLIYTQRSALRIILRKHTVGGILSESCQKAHAKKSEVFPMVPRSVLWFLASPVKFFELHVNQWNALTPRSIIQQVAIRSTWWLTWGWLEHQALHCTS